MIYVTTEPTYSSNFYSNNYGYYDSYASACYWEDFGSNMDLNNTKFVFDYPSNNSKY